MASDDSVLGLAVALVVLVLGHLMLRLAVLLWRDRRARDP